VSPAARSPAVCLVGESYFPNLDGGAVHSRSLAEALARAGHPVLVITRQDYPSYPARETLGGVPVIRVPPTQHSGMLGRYLSMFTVGAQVFLRRRDYDLLLVSSLRILGLPVVALARLLGKPCVARADSCGELSGEYALRPPGRRGLRDGLAIAWFRARNLVVKRADAFVSISSAVSEEFRALGIPADRIHDITNGIDTDAFAPIPESEKAAERARLGLPVDAVIVAYSGRLTTEKGLPLLMRTWVRVSRAHPEAHLVLIGSGENLPLSCEPELRAFTARHDLEKRVTFTGAVERVHEVLRCADLFAFPSETEALGLALIEALSCEVPAVASRVGGIPDIVDDGVQGRLFESGDEDGLCAALDALIADPDVRREMGRRGRERALERFSLPRIITRYQALFDAVLGARD